MYSKIWLAGLGAYGRSEKLGKEGIKLLDELAGEGVDVRDRAADKIASVKQHIRSSVQDNVDKVKGLLHIPSKNKDIDSLSRQVEELSAAVNALAQKPAQTTKKTAYGQRGKAS